MDFNKIVSLDHCIGWYKIKNGKTVIRNDEDYTRQSHIIASFSFTSTLQMCVNSYTFFAEANSVNQYFKWKSHIHQMAKSKGKEVKMNQKANRRP